MHSLTPRRTQSEWKADRSSAAVVILAAGTLGTTEIWLRSREKNNGRFVVSDALGTRVSTNGDFSGFVIVDPDKLAYPIYGNRGPINMSHVTFRDGRLLVNVEDTGIPSMSVSMVQHLRRLSRGQARQTPIQGSLNQTSMLLWSSTAQDGVGYVG